VLNATQEECQDVTKRRRVHGWEQDEAERKDEIKSR